MNNNLKRQITIALNKEYLRRKLIQYFSDKGFKTFDYKPYPPILQDLTDHVNILSPVVEVKFDVEDIDLQSNYVKLIWNIFILGNKRIFLGYTVHPNISDVPNEIGSIDKHHDGPYTIEQIIDHIINMLAESDSIINLKQLESFPKRDINRAFGRQNTIPMPFRRISP